MNKLLKKYDIVSWIYILLLISIIISSLMLGIFEKYILQYIINFILGLIINYIILYLILLGKLGINLRNILINDEKFINNFNIVLLIFLSLYLILVLNMDTIYMDGNIVNIKMDDLDFRISGEYIDKIFTHFGGSAAFIAGAKIAASFLIKKNISVSNKLAISLGGGVGFSTGYHIINMGNEKLRNYLKYKVEDNKIDIFIEKVEITTDLNNTISGDKITYSKLESFLPKFKDYKENFNLLDYNKKINLRFNNNKEFIVDSKSNIISNLEKNNSKTITEIFQNKEEINFNVDTSNLVNSPLELNNLEKINDINDIIILLNYNLILNIVIIYFIYVLFIIFTIKIITDRNINLDNIKNYYFGKYIYFILSKLIKSWNINNIFWIYFLLFSLFVFSCISTFGIYVSIVVLS